MHGVTTPTKILKQTLQSSESLLLGSAIRGGYADEAVSGETGAAGVSHPASSKQNQGVNR